MMNAVCKMTGEATTWPCSAHGCPLYGDCLSEYAGKSKPMTNADRIRAMSDEELAEELVIEIEGLFPSLVYVPMATGNIYISRDKAEKEMLEYLQQPAEEEP